MDNSYITTTVSSALGDLTSNMKGLECRFDYLDFTVGKITASISHNDTIGISLNQEINEVRGKNDALEVEVKNLKKIIARLNTRVNNLIAEKQINNFNKKE